MIDSLRIHYVYGYSIASVAHRATIGGNPITNKRGGRHTRIKRFVSLLGAYHFNQVFSSCRILNENFTSSKALASDIGISKATAYIFRDPSIGIK